MVVIFVAVAAALVLTGCGGVQAQRSVSPASFFIPGLLKADPTPPKRLDQPEPAKEVALLR
ncbi:MAG: hypothetical protein EPO07_13105 [Verrucomicrobia bacterium]|nr:MAG: hypothetical protein EPO07_13105 [Verrucomicrobiota bacterium]